MHILKYCIKSLQTCTIGKKMRIMHFIFIVIVHAEECEVSKAE